MDESAERFAQLYDAYIWTVYGFFGYRLGSHEDAEYFTEQTFAHALEAWDSFDEQRAGPVAWLLTIARNLLVDHHTADSDPPIGEGFGPDPELEAALGRLSDRDREVLALRFGADLTGTDIAGLTGLGLANVQQVISSSLRRLRGELDAPARN